MSNQAYNEIYGARADGGPMTGEASSTSMLDMMRDRLASLSDEARSIRGQVPHEFEPDVERIQQQMQRLGERLSDLSRGALVPYSAAQRAGERRSKEVRFVTEDDVRVGRAQPDQVIALGSAGGQRRAEPRYDGNAWDDAAANALAELYESGEAFAVHARRESASVAAASVRSTARAVSNRASDRPQYAAAMGGMSAPQAAPRGCAMDSNLLDQRFAEIAARIEESLRQIRPEAALASLTSRFDQLETQINTMIGQMATRADLEELRVAEAQIEEIASQLNQLRRQMARLDMIDAHLGTLTSQLSDERLTRLFNEGVQVTADVGRLDAIDAQLRMIAVQLSDERLSGLVSRSSAHDVDYDEVAQSAAHRVAASFAANSHERDTSAREIGEVRGMLESLINERRHNDENNASMLETMQQAIIRVLDRIDALEVTQPQVAMQPHAAAPMMAQPERQQPQPVAKAAPTAPAPVAATPAPVSYDDDLIPATATVFAEMRGLAEVTGAEVGEASDFLPPEETESSPADLEAFMADEVSENAAPPRIPVYTTSSFNLDEAFSSARNAEALSFGEPQPAKRPIEVLRHDFIADAHRAKLKAASKPDVSDDDLRSGELSVGAREPAAKPRRRSIFSFRSQRVAMSLLVLLAAIPAAIFFMPRTNADHLDAATPAAITLDPAAAGHASEEPLDAEPMVPAQPRVVPPLNAPSKQTRQDMQAPMPSMGDERYEDANAVGAPIDTASLPDGIALQNADVGPSGAQVAQFNEQARMAHLSGQVGIAAAHATPAALMQDQLLRESGVDTTADSGAVSLPPATVGPYSLRLAAAQGDVSAQFEVASRLAEGKGTDQDLIEAAQWYQRAAAKGFPLAQFRLGTLYERGMGVKADPQRAQVWYERAAVQGNVKAMHNLAVLLASRSPKPDYKSAARWFTAAADFGLGDSQFNLAVLYENGMGVAKDQQQAYKWLVLAAKSGDKDAAARRDSLKAKLSAGEVAAAETAAKDWRAKAMPNMANDARLAGQAWRDGTRRG